MIIHVIAWSRPEAHCGSNGRWWTPTWRDPDSPRHSGADLPAPTGPSHPDPAGRPGHTDASRCSSKKLYPVFFTHNNFIAIHPFLSFHFEFLIFLKKELNLRICFWICWNIFSCIFLFNQLSQEDTQNIQVAVSLPQPTSVQVATVTTDSGEIVQIQQS